jgi:hypothetical protein
VDVAAALVSELLLAAHVRHYAITVLGDAVIALDRELGEAALRMMSRNMSAPVLTTRQWNNKIP